MSPLIGCARCSESLAQVTTHIVIEDELRTLSDCDWALSEKPDADLVVKALDVAYEQRGKPQGMLAGRILLSGLTKRSSSLKPASGSCR